MNFLCTKIETVALRSGASDADCADLEGTLASMSPLARERVQLMLDGIAIQTEYEDPVMAFAARYILRLANDIWQANPHPTTHSSSSPRHTSRRD